MDHPVFLLTLPTEVTIMILEVLANDNLPRDQLEIPKRIDHEETDTQAEGATTCRPCWIRTVHPNTGGPYTSALANVAATCRYLNECAEAITFRSIRLNLFRPKELETFKSYVKGKRQTTYVKTITVPAPRLPCPDSWRFSAVHEVHALFDMLQQWETAGSRVVNVSQVYPVEYFDKRVRTRDVSPSPEYFDLVPLEPSEKPHLRPERMTYDPKLLHVLVDSERKLNHVFLHRVLPSDLRSPWLHERSSLTQDCTCNPKYMKKWTTKDGGFFTLSSISWTRPWKDEDVMQFLH